MVLLLFCSLPDYPAGIPLIKIFEACIKSKHLHFKCVLNAFTIYLIHYQWSLAYQQKSLGDSWLL